MKPAMRKRRKQTSQPAVGNTAPEEAGTNEDRKERKEKMKKITASSSQRTNKKRIFVNRVELSQKPRPAGAGRKYAG